MSKLVTPKEHQQRKASQRKDSEAKVTEQRHMMARLVSQPEYKMLKQMAATVAKLYRDKPGSTEAEDASYLTHCKIVWAYNTLFSQVEQIARVAPRSLTDDDSRQQSDW